MCGGKTIFYKKEAIECFFTKLMQFKKLLVGKWLLLLPQVELTDFIDYYMSHMLVS